MALRLRAARRRREGLLRRQCAAHVQDVKLSVRPKGTLDDPARVEGDRDEPCFASAAPSTAHRHRSSISSTCSAASASAASITASGSSKAEAKMTLARDHPRLVLDVIDGMRAMSSGGADAAADRAAAAGRRPPPATLQVGRGDLSICRVPVIWAGLPPMAQLQSFPRRHRKARRSSMCYHRRARSEHCSSGTSTD